MDLLKNNEWLNVVSVSFKACMKVKGDIHDEY